MNNEYQENQKKAFKMAVGVLRNNKNGTDFRQVPQIAFVFESINGKMIGKVFINYHSKHAEVQALKSIELEKYEDKSLNIFVSSHPCERCLGYLSKDEIRRKIKNVFYISKSSYLHKVELYNKIAKEKGLLPYEGLGINFNKYNNYNNGDVSILTDEIDDNLNMFLQKELIIRFAKHLLKYNKDVNIEMTIEKYKDEIHNLEELGKVLGKRIYKVGKNFVLINRTKLEEAMIILKERAGIKEKVSTN